MIANFESQEIARTMAIIAEAEATAEKVHDDAEGAIYDLMETYDRAMSEAEATADRCAVQFYARHAVLRTAQAYRALANTMSPSEDLDQQIMDTFAGMARDCAVSLKTEDDLLEAIGMFEDVLKQLADDDHRDDGGADWSNPALWKTWDGIRLNGFYSLRVCIRATIHAIRSADPRQSQQAMAEACDWAKGIMEAIQ